ncbi:MAG: TonB-dependent receptor [Acidobacteriota bacterium]|nr:TonB-dependent receptor [Acidobacteriota bacterium]
MITYFLALILAAWGDEAESNDDLHQTITVTAPRSQDNREPRAVVVVDADETLRGQPRLSMREAMRGVPGVMVHNRHNLSQGDRITIRGIGARAQFGVRGLKLLMDGIPLTMPDGQAQLNNLDLTAVGTIRVLRGPASSLYGNASGGVVEAWSRLPVERGISAVPSALSGADGYRSYRLAVSGYTGDFRFQVNGTRHRSDGFRDHAQARFDRVNLAMMQTLTDRWSLSLAANSYDAPYLLNPSSLNRADAETRPRYARGFIVARGASKAVDQQQAGLTLRYRGARLTAETTVYGVRRELINPIPARVIDLDRDAAGLRTMFRTEWNHGLSLSAGMDMESMRDDRREFLNLGLPGDPAEVPPSLVIDSVIRGERQLDQIERVRNLGPFVELNRDFSAGWLLTLGARYDYFRFQVDDQLPADGDDSGRRTMNRLSPMLGLSRQFGENHRVYANLSTAFQTPTTSELSNRPDGGGGFDETLEPEVTRGLELGYRGQNAGSVRWQAALFAARTDDMLTPFQTDDGGTVFFRNAGEVSRRGFECAANLAPAPGLNLDLAYTLLRVQFESFAPNGNELAGNDVPGIPPQTLFAGLSRRKRPFFGAAEVIWEDAYWANDVNGPPDGTGDPADYRNPSAAVTNIRLGLDLTRGKITGRIYAAAQNLFNTRANGSIVPNAFGNRFFEPAPGRTWMIGLDLRFGGPQ